MVGISNNIIFQWIQENISLVDGVNPVSIHLPDLLLFKPKKNEVISLAVEVYSQILIRILSLGNPIQPMMVIPLKSDSKTILRQSPNNMMDLQEQIDLIESPSFYLLSWSKLKKTTPIEEYREPLQFRLFDCNMQNIYSFYREHRYALAISEDWEFSRGIYVEYYPDGLLNN